MSTIDPAQAELFSGMAAEWWDRSGSSALLHKVNPVRVKYIREQVGAHFARDTIGARWLDGLDCLDVGCGGGILSECLARLGGEVTAIDAAEDSVKVAIAHAEAQGLEIDYRLAATDVLVDEGRTFDLITCMEVVEHVADVPAFLAGLRALLKPGGLLVFSTPNRTAMSFGVMILGAEWVLRLLPRGTHEWDRFLTPAELTRALATAGLKVTDLDGIALDLARGFELSDDRKVNYIGAAVAG
ncbi:MAG: bifunctional 2-polyprenyl-6-hydroxyphenol methylase/3-demethylubiquinol 3-O-methyltransferase UbiG [Pacificimonas sp.]